MAKKSKVFVVARHGEIDQGVERIILERYGSNTKIESVHSLNVFTPKGLATLIQQNKNTGIVYVLGSEMPPSAIVEAREIGLPFGVLERDAETKKLGIVFLNAPSAFFPAPVNESPQ